MHIQVNTMANSDYQSLIKILSDEFGDLSALPEGAILAGQAVAAAWFMHRGLPIKAPMKDLDVFSQAPVNWYDEDGLTFIHGERHGQPEVKAFNTSYADIQAFPVNKGSYTVLASRMQGRINTVFITSLVISAADFKAINLLDGFDINSAAIALDTQQQCVVMHPDFETFCQTRQLQAMNFFTPAPTAIRLLEKSVNLGGIYFDEESELTKIALVLAVNEQPDGYYRKGHGISEERMVRLQQTPHFDKLSRYFTFSVEVRGQITLHKFTARKDTLEPAFQQFVQSFNKMSTIHADGWPAYAVRPFFDKYFHRIHQAFPMDNSLESDSVRQWGLLIWAVKLPHIPFQHIRMKAFSALCWKHPVVVSLVSCAKDAAEVNALVKLLVWTENHYPELFGQMETRQFAVEDFTSQFKSIGDLKAHKAVFYADLEKYKVPVSLNGFNHKGINIHEITNKLELVQTGYREHHCVGGYWSWIEQGRCLIFTMSSTQGYSTVDVRYHTSASRLTRNGRFYIAQHHGKANEEPPALHKAAETVLLTRLERLKAPRLAPYHRKPLWAIVKSAFGKSESGYPYPITDDINSEQGEIIPF
jgi:hypothetical protein